MTTTTTPAETTTARPDTTTPLGMCYYGQCRLSDVPVQAR